MVNYLGLTQHPQIKHEIHFEVIRDFRKGGLNPGNYEEFIALVRQLPPISKRTANDYLVFAKLNLTDISLEEKSIITKEVIKRGIANTKKCWHPLASPQTCKLDSSGKILVSAAHSIQNNGILNKIASDQLVMKYHFDKSEFDGEEIRKNVASIFWGFCNTHDSIFYPVENKPYQNTLEQNFLFAYRAFVVASHKKLEVCYSMEFGEDGEKDLIANKIIFDDSILNKNYDTIETVVFELPAFYPIAASSAFYLDYDFEGNPIPHSDERMENIHVTFFPAENTSFFLLSYLAEDKHLYGHLGDQLKKRNNLKSDITMLIAGHTDNVYFNPTYYTTFIEKHEDVLKQILLHTQFDHGTVHEDNSVEVNFSFTPSNYLNNPYDINYFGY